MQAGNDDLPLFSHGLLSAKSGKHAFCAIHHTKRNPQPFKRLLHGGVSPFAHQTRFHIDGRHPFAKRLMRQYGGHSRIHAAAHAAHRKTAFNRSVRQHTPRLGQRSIHGKPWHASADVARKILENGRAIRIVALQFKLNAKKRASVVRKGDGAAARACRHLHIGREHQRHGFLNIAFSGLHA